MRTVNKQLRQYISASLIYIGIISTYLLFLKAVEVVPLDVLYFKRKKIQKRRKMLAAPNTKGISSKNAASIV
ncbi:hypothetical protein [Candidatus Endomicrobiellum agilis]|uniref:hypothetical protein n=1 Tax=Candidatus Endomicrobiellum agilis TaxID=3238957 RepID=UPI00357F78A1|nr:hypothetical protein [Endomicrobium sp.]